MTVQVMPLQLVLAAEFVPKMKLFFILIHNLVCRKSTNALQRNHWPLLCHWSATRRRKQRENWPSTWQPGHHLAEQINKVHSPTSLTANDTLESSACTVFTFKKAKVTVCILDTVLLTWVDSWTAALYNLVSGSWLAWASGTQFIFDWSVLLSVLVFENGTKTVVLSDFETTVQTAQFLKVLVYDDRHILTNAKNGRRLHIFWNTADKTFLPNMVQKCHFGSVHCVSLVVTLLINYLKFWRNIAPTLQLYYSENCSFSSVQFYKTNSVITHEN